MACFREVNYDGIDFASECYFLIVAKCRLLS